MATIYYYKEETDSIKKHSVKKAVTAVLSTIIVGVVIGMQFNSLVAASTATVYISSPVTAPVILPSDPPVSTPSSTSSTNNSNNSNSSNSASNSSSSTSCNDTTPKGSPRLVQITTTDTKATLFVSPVSGNITAYAVTYGTKPTIMSFGTTLTVNTKGIVQLPINALKPNTTYYFTVRAVNGCSAGSVSNMLKATTTARFGRVRVTTAWEQTRAIVLSWMR